MHVPVGIRIARCRVGLCAEDAEDVAHTQLLRALEPGAPLFRGLADTDAAPPRFRIACYRRGISLLRPQWRLQYSLPEEIERVGGSHGAAEEAEREETLSEAIGRLPGMGDCIGKLSERERQVFLLRVLEAEPFSGIAGRLGLAVSASTSYYSTARGKLRKCLTAHRERAPQQHDWLERLQVGDAR